MYPVIQQSKYTQKTRVIFSWKQSQILFLILSSFYYQSSWNEDLQRFHELSLNGDAVLDVDSIGHVDRHIRILPEQAGKIDLTNQANKHQNFRTSRQNTEFLEDPVVAYQESAIVICIHPPTHPQIEWSFIL